MLNRILIALRLKKKSKPAEQQKPPAARTYSAHPLRSQPHSLMTKTRASPSPAPDTSNDFTNMLLMNSLMANNHNNLNDEAPFRGGSGGDFGGGGASSSWNAPSPSPSYDSSSSSDCSSSSDSSSSSCSSD